jgi:hypothetical protein
VADDAVLIEQVSASNSQITAINREINREFRRIQASTAICVSDQRADSIAYSQIRCATELGISECVSGNFLEEHGKSSNSEIKQQRTPLNCGPTPCCVERITLPL